MPVCLLAASLVLGLGGDVAWSAMGARMGGRAGGFAGGRSFAPPAPHRGDFGRGRFVGRRFADPRFVHGHHGRHAFFPSWGGYDVDYEYDPYESYEPLPRGYPRAGHCEVASGSYPQYCVWKEGP